MTNMYIDDERCPRDSVSFDLITRSYTEATEWMSENGCPSYVSFDHDLGDKVPTGFDIAKWMVEQDLNSKGKFIPEDFIFNVHSANPVGSANIIGLLNNYLEKR